MNRLKPEVDIVLDILKAVNIAQPESSFIQSLLHQYQERGGLSKKQLQGLYAKAQKFSSIPENKLATLEAIILKKHTRFRSELPAKEEPFKKDEEAGQLIKSILQRFPQHKRVLFLQSKFEGNEILTTQELAELRKFQKLLS